MKKILLSLMMAMIAFIASAQTIGEAFYIYRNDGGFNAFFRDEVDSIAYSNYDADSIWYDDVVTQVVYTPDSTYCIPLAAIDSVGFVQPERIYQNDVVKIDSSWITYIIHVTDSTITFRSDIPSSYLPNKGQVIVSETLEEPFTTGFAGRVSQFHNYADSIVCHVEEVGLTEIYKRLVCKGVSSSYDDTQDDNNPAKKRIWGINTEGMKFPLPNIEIEMGPINLSCNPNVTMTYIICLWEQNLKNYVNIKFKHVYEGEASLNAKYEKDYTPEPKWNKKFISIPTEIPGLYGKILFGGFVRAKGSVELAINQPFTITGNAGFEYSEDKGLIPINSWKGEMKDTEASINLDGSISGGLAIRLLFGIMHDKLASADVTAYLGPQLSGEFKLSSAGFVDRTLYSSIKDSEVKLSLLAEVVPGYRFVLQREHHELPLSLNLSYDINHWYLVPEFSNLSWEQKNITLQGVINRNLLPKVALGWALYDTNDNLYKSQYFNETYRKIEDWQHNGLEMQLKERPKGKYRAYPLVKLMGVEMRADESVDVVSEIPVEITNFEVTSSKHKDNGFYHNGSYYDYAFYAATTVVLKESEGVADWGYVYEDPNRQPAHISLKAYCSPYTDTNYAYYRNSAHDHVCLYEYVKYEGDPEYYYGEKKTYNLDYEEKPLCPDDNHPHMIDLGLPSGTKWACCNVGANKPEDYGGYYAWGETEEKSVYNWDTYVFFDSCNIGFGLNIAGSQYDVAHIKWGGSWVMPSISQIDELKYHCTYIWTTMNGVLGGQFTGPSGGTIFIPAAGAQWGNGFDGAGNYGEYWGSTQILGGPYSQYYAARFSFDSYKATWSHFVARCVGFTVRPVAK